MRVLLFVILLTFINARVQSQETPFYLGADLSYTNELEDNGAIFKKDGIIKDPFELFADESCNLVRIRLWHSPNWKTFCNDENTYSNLTDVIRSLKRAKNAGMKTLLCPHYSDNWADPGKQLMPSAWSNIEEFDILLDSAYQYTFDVLKALVEEDLIPDYIQIGNETNSGFIDPVLATDGMDWERDSQLFKTCIRAVRDVESLYAKSIKILLHVAQPENADWWLNMATANGITDFDVIGLSYYPKWSTNNLTGLGAVIETLGFDYQKEIMIVETGYPWTIEFNDSAGNIMGDGSGTLEEFPISKEGQRNYLLALSETAYENGASGVIYWEPAWISTSACTQWGQGSHWENVCFFNFNGEALPAFDFYKFDASVGNENTIIHSSVVFPNPARDYVNIQLQNKSRIQLLDLQGNVLKEIHSDIIQWHLPNLIPGTYLVKIINGKGQQVRKLVFY